jgi:phosphoglycerate dehydrogenase-like enzyme
VSLLLSVPDAELASALGDLGPDVVVVVWDLFSPAPAPQLDLVVTSYLRLVPSLAALEGVGTRLVQSQSIGYDGVAAALGPGRVFANAAGVHEASTAELAVTLTLASLRGVPGFVRTAEGGRWIQAFHPALADRRVVLVGYGGVGRAIAARLAPFEVDLVRVARRARSTPEGPVHATSELPDLLPSADVVIVAVPLDDATTGMVDEAFLAAMPDGALLVNVARGKVADTAALARHAGAGRISLALDVVDPEPLPPDHPLWSMPNVLISPHVGGASSAMLPRIVHLVREQARRLARGEEPLNVVLRT